MTYTEFQAYEPALSKLLVLSLVVAVLVVAATGFTAAVWLWFGVGAVYLAHAATGLLWAVLRALTKGRA